MSSLREPPYSKIRRLSRPCLWRSLLAILSEIAFVFKALTAVMLNLFSSSAFLLTRFRNEFGMTHFFQWCLRLRSRHQSFLRHKKLYTLLSIEKSSRIQFVYEPKTLKVGRIQTVYFLSIEFSCRIQYVYSKKTRKVVPYTYCILLCQRIFEPYTMCTRRENSTNQSVYNF